MFHRWRPRVRRWGRSSVRSVSTSQHSSKVGTCNRIVRESYRVTYSPLVAIEPVIKDVRCKSNRKVISVTTFRLQPEDVDLPRGRACALCHHGEPRPQPQPPDDAPALPLAHQTGKAETWKLYFENINISRQMTFYRGSIRNLNPLISPAGGGHPEGRHARLGRRGRGQDHQVSKAPPTTMIFLPPKKYPN